MKSKRIYLVRHAETDWNRERRYQGWTDRPLTDRGEESFRCIVDHMNDLEPDFVVSSPTGQARGLAASIAAPRTIVIDERWSEIDHGAWEGLRHDDVVRRFGPGAAERFDDPFRYSDHGGETLADVESRVARAWDDLAAMKREVIAVVTHATPIRLVLCRCLELPADSQWRFRIDNGGLTGISVAGDAATIEFVNHRVTP